MEKRYYFLGSAVILIVIGIFLIFNLGFVNLFTGKATSQSLNINVTLSPGGGSAPLIYNVTVDNSWAVSLSLGPSTSYVIVNFSSNDSNGGANIDASTANVTLQLLGSSHRYNTTCLRTAVGIYDANFSCKVPMYWYDNAGNWAINISIKDLNSNTAINSSYLLTVGTLTGFESGPSNISFGTLNAGTTNQTATTDPLIMNNTGNVNITNGSIAVNGTNLVGETTNTQAIYAGNFSVGLSTGSSAECNYGNGFSIATRINQSYGSYTNINNSLLTTGNYTINDGRAQENFYLCILEIGGELSQQAYYSNYSWTIKIA